MNAIPKHLLPAISGCFSDTELYQAYVSSQWYFCRKEEIASTPFTIIFPFALRLLGQHIRERHIHVPVAMSNAGHLIEFVTGQIARAS